MEAVPRWLKRAVTRPALGFEIRGGLPKEYFFMLVADHCLALIGRSFRIRLDSGRPRSDRIEPALHVRKVIEVLLLYGVLHDPWIARHISDGIIGSRDERPTLQATIEHAI